VARFADDDGPKVPDQVGWKPGCGAGYPVEK
jgi:hypothetical protein